MRARRVFTASLTVVILALSATKGWTEPLTMTLSSDGQKPNTAPHFAQVDSWPDTKEGLDNLLQELRTRLQDSRAGDQELVLMPYGEKRSGFRRWLDKRMVKKSLGWRAITEVATRSDLPGPLAKLLGDDQKKILDSGEYRAFVGEPKLPNPPVVPRLIMSTIRGAAIAGAVFAPIVLSLPEDMAVWERVITALEDWRWLPAVVAASMSATLQYLDHHYVAWVTSQGWFKISPGNSGSLLNYLTKNFAVSNLYWLILHKTMVLAGLADPMPWVDTIAKMGEISLMGLALSTPLSRAIDGMYPNAADSSEEAQKKRTTLASYKVGISAWVTMGQVLMSLDSSTLAAAGDGMLWGTAALGSFLLFNASPLKKLTNRALAAVGKAVSCVDLLKGTRPPLTPARATR